MSKRRNILPLFAIALVSAAAAGLFALWLFGINANTTLKVIAPSVIFISTFLGVWLLFNFTRVIRYQRRGVRGYKLRGKITSYFLLSTLGFIVVFGALMFYLIFLIENTFLEKERSVAYNLQAGYKTMIELNKRTFELTLKIDLVVKPDSFPVIFRLDRDGEVRFRKSTAPNIAKAVLHYRDSIAEYFSDPKNRFLYIGVTSSFVVARGGSGHGDVLYATATDKNLTDAFIVLKSNTDALNRLRLLKQYIFPVSVLSIFILAVPILVGAFFVSLFVAKNITEPIETIARGTKIIADGNLDHKVQVRTHDEIGDLAYHFNSMATKLKAAQAQLKRIERLEAWQEMAKRLAHEVKNPLTPIKLSAERLVYSYETGRPDFLQILQKTSSTIINETKRLENLVNEFSRFARLPNPKLEVRDLVKTVRDVIVFFENAYPDFRIEDRIGVAEMPVAFDENQIKQVFINILRNALDARRPASDGPGATVWTELDEERFLVMFRDYGTGIPPEVQERIFEPYFTTKPEGTGIGLAVAERILLDHGGNIWFESSPEGATFIVEFPLKPPPQTEQGDSA